MKVDFFDLFALAKILLNIVGVLKNAPTKQNRYNQRKEIEIPRFFEKSFPKLKEEIMASHICSGR